MHFVALQLKLLKQLAIKLEVEYDVNIVLADTSTALTRILLTLNLIEIQKVFIVSIINLVST